MGESEQTDLGFDIRFFDNALNFGFDYFKKKDKWYVDGSAYPKLCWAERTHC